MFSEPPQRRIRALQFGLLSPEEVRRGSAVHVQHPETMEGGLPKENGLADLRMGTTERSWLCQTCGGGVHECNGHFGHIELTRPMYHVGYLARIKKTLDCVCFYCSKLKLPRAAVPQGLHACWEVLKGRSVCEAGCFNRQPVIRRDGLQLVATAARGEDPSASSDGGKVLLSGEKVYGILKRISEEDAAWLGYSAENCRPEWMLITTVLVPPPCVRPAVVTGSSLRCEDDLTHKLADIVKANQQLARYEQEGAAGHVVRDYEALLQFHLATFVDNNISGQPQSLQKSGRPLKCISARLKGKEGRVRGNLMGKRVDFSARSVITPDPNISCDEVGVPEHVARILTFPQRVSALNLSRLQALVRRGPDAYPGANYVTRRDGQRLDLRFSREELRLEPGCVVERHMQSGDFVLFNRQPSLHKMSMMGHRALVMRGKTFRLNLSVTAPYNADFDGDEMNLHMPQTETARAELGLLADVSHQIVSPQGSRPVIGIVQDACLGAWLLTQRSTFLARREAMALLAALEALPRRGDDVVRHTLKSAILQPVKLWTGKQLFSAALPEIWMGGNAPQDAERQKDKVQNFLSNKNAHDTQFCVRAGRLLAGTAGKRLVGAQAAGLIHFTWRDFGPAVARLLINNIQRMVNCYMQHVQAFSVGIGDCVADSGTLQLCQRSISAAMGEVDAVIAAAKRGRLEKLPGQSLAESFESRVNLVLNRARDISGTSAQRSLATDNGMKAMVVAGSKGSYINISQVTTCVGQQNVEGKRIPFGFRQRTLPHFTKFDFSARARGFVERSYLTGLSPSEFFFHAMGGREGLIDTAIKTAETGYIQRRLVKALEDATVHHDASVRNSGGNVVQFVYGDDAFDAAHLERLPGDGVVESLLMALVRLKESGELRKESGEQQDKMKSVKDVGEEWYAAIRRALALLANKTEEEIEASCCDILDSSSRSAESHRLVLLLSADKASAHAQRPYAAPVDLQRLFQRFSSTDGARPGLARIFEAVEELTVIVRSFGLLPLSNNLLLEAYLRASFEPSLVRERLSARAFERVVGEARAALLRAFVNAGEMVGTLAAQSVGEPATQMTLNTFHLAGVSSNITMGVPRFNEIINVARRIRTPSMRVPLAAQYRASADAARAVQSRIEFTRLRDVASAACIVYDPVPEETIVAEDRELVAAYYEMPDEEIDSSTLDRFVIRIEADRASLIARGLTPESLVAAVRKSFAQSSTRLHAIYSDENDERPIIRLRMVNSRSSSSSAAAESDTAEEDAAENDNEKRRDAERQHTPGFYSSQRATTAGASTSISHGMSKVEAQLDALDRVLDTYLQGIAGINRAYITQSADGSWELQTDGVNLRAMMSFGAADGTRVVANDLVAVWEVLGIEAARQAILDELSFVIEANGSFVNHRHMALLADVMCLRGSLSGITRHGVNREAASALKRASFEQTVDVLLEAAVSSQNDTSAGITENIMMGQLAPLGTGTVELCLDHSKLAFCRSARSPGHSALGDMLSGALLGYSSPTSDAGSVAWSPDYNTLLYDSSSTGGASQNQLLFSPLTSSAASPSFSPGYSPASPSYSPVSPGYSPVSPSYSPVSPSYSPGSPSYSPASPSYSPVSPSYSPVSPSYSPVSASYVPVSPSYSPVSPSYSPVSPSYSPVSPSYSPVSPSYRPSSSTAVSREEKDAKAKNKDKKFL